MTQGNLTNEGGVAGTIRLLKNVMGLWLVQEARRAVAIGGSTLSYEQLSAMAQAARGFTAFIDPDDESFLRPGDLPTAVRPLPAPYRTATAPARARVWRPSSGIPTATSAWEPLP